MCANALMSFDVTFKNSDVWLSPWCLLIMYSPGTFWLSGGLVGFYQLCWFDQDTSTGLQVRHQQSGARASSRAIAAGPISLWPITYPSVWSHCAVFLLGTSVGALLTVWIFFSSV